ncbi:MAG: alpha/beta fold hydrolase [Actinomycetota bacterium]
MPTASGIPHLRTPDENFDGLVDFPFEPHYADIDGLRMHYVDEGPRDAPVALLMHGMPTWSYLYRTMIPPLLAAGYRCVAPDHIGFGRSDKVTDSAWYTIARHTSNMRLLVESLDLGDITLFVQDWGGPIGLAQFAAMPERFSRLVIMNTWLHHDTYEYTPGILDWITRNSPGGMLRENVPAKFNWGLLMTMATRRATPADSMIPAVSGGTPNLTPEADMVRRAYDAPFLGLGEDAVTGPRRFPLCIPVNDPVAGNADEQAGHFAAVNAASVPVHFVWGTEDNVFVTEWGRTWQSMIPGATWDEVAAGHFLQDTHGPEIVAAVLRHAAGR